MFGYPDETLSLVFDVHCITSNNCKALRFLMNLTLVEILLKIHNGLIEFVLFSRQFICKNLEDGVNLSAISRMFFSAIRVLEA